MYLIFFILLTNLFYSFVLITFASVYSLILYLCFINFILTFLLLFPVLYFCFHHFILTCLFLLKIKDGNFPKTWVLYVKNSVFQVSINSQGNLDENLLIQKFFFKDLFLKIYFEVVTHLAIFRSAGGWNHIGCVAPTRSHVSRA